MIPAKIPKILSSVYLFSHNFSSDWILGKNLLYFCFIKTFSKLLFGFPFVLSPIIVVKKSSRKSKLSMFIYIMD